MLIDLPAEKDVVQFPADGTDGIILLCGSPVFKIYSTVKTAVYIGAVLRIAPAIYTFSLEKYTVPILFKAVDGSLIHNVYRVI
jgi:hypothetical protein